MKLLTWMTTLTLSGVVFAQSPDLTQMKDDLRIMTDIIESTFGMDHGRFPHRRSDGELKPQNIKANYLRGQGVVLRFQLGRGMDRLFFDSMELSSNFEIAFAPEPPGAFSATVSTSTPMTEEQRDALREAERLASRVTSAALASGDDLSALLEAIPQVSDAEMQANLRALRAERSEMIRSLQQEIAETRRELRDTELDRAEQAERRQEIDRMRQQLDEANQAYEEKLQTIKREQLGAWDDKITQFEGKLLDVMCARIGNLRALPKNERVSLIVEGAYRSETGEPQDKIYIFKLDDLLACRDGQIDKDALLKRGESYRF